MKMIIFTFLCINLFSSDSAEKNTSTLENKIVGGSNTEYNDRKYMASIRLRREHQCSAVVITASNLISSASCVYFLEALKPEYDGVSVTVGSTCLEAFVLLYDVAHISIPDTFKPNILYYYSPNDIAVVTILGLIKFRSLVQKIDLPDKHSYQYNSLEIIGWGVQNYSEPQNNHFSYSLDLKYAKVELVELQVCKDHYRKDGVITYKNQLCVLPIEGAPSKGDRGGPLVYKNILMGVLSHFSYYDPDFNTPSIYTNVTKYIKYINIAVGKGRKIAEEKRSRLKQFRHIDTINDMLNFPE